MSIKNVPRTLAIIPDGNRRWARAHTLSIFNGYDQGVKNFFAFADWCLAYGINNISVWAFSTENFSRAPSEVKTLFRIYMKMAKDKSVIARLHKNKTRLRIIGNRRLLPKDLLRALGHVERETKMYKDRVINMLIGYGGKDDILNAVKKAVGTVKNASAVNESMFRKLLITSGLPEIDFIIRTSGEHRLSGFLPWQTSYSELYFSNKLWPDFTKRDLRAALLDYNRRQRRFGK